MMLTQRIAVVIFSVFSTSMLFFYWIISEVPHQRAVYRGLENTFSSSKIYPHDKLDFHEQIQNVTPSFEFTELFSRSCLVAVRLNDESTSSTKLACSSEFFITECHNPGLAAMLLMTLDHFSSCRLIGAKPTVFWRNCYTVCPDNASINAWEWYFEPVNPGIENQAKKVLCLGSSLSPNEILTRRPDLVNREKGDRHFSPTGLLELSFRPRHFQSFIRQGVITTRVRLFGNSMITKYIKVKPKIQKVVDDFYNQHLDGFNVLAVHIRGTDHALETEEGVLPPLTAWVQNAEYILKNMSSPHKIFVASDNAESIREFANTFGKKAVFTNALRAIKYNGTAIHDSNLDPYTIGSQVLVDILLMAKCQHFLHAESSVASLVTYFSPKINDHYLEIPKSSKKNDEDAGKGKFANFIPIKDSYTNNEHAPPTLDQKENDDDLMSAFICYKNNSPFSVCPNFPKAIFKKLF